MIDRKVKVYRNLHKDTLSLMAADGPERGRVIGYSDFDAEGRLAPVCAGGKGAGRDGPGGSAAAAEKPGTLGSG